MKNATHDGCPSCSTIATIITENAGEKGARLSHWPIQIKLIGTVARFLNDADQLVAADCTAFAAAALYKTSMQDRKVLIGCPRLDVSKQYFEKCTDIFANTPIRSVSILGMEVPCC